MKATDANLLTFINKAPQFVIPIYQRTYSWTEKECRQLWEDVRRAGRSAHIPVHFLGSVVYVEETLSTNTSRSPQLVIDGQQRLTSVTLLLTALSRVIKSGSRLTGSRPRKSGTAICLTRMKMGNGRSSCSFQKRTGRH